MGLAKTGLLSQTETGEFARLDAGPQGLAQIVLQSTEFHGAKYSMGYNQSLLPLQVQHLKGNKVLDRDYILDTKLGQ